MLIGDLLAPVSQLRELRLVFLLLSVLFLLYEAQDPISELFIIDQHFVLDGRELVDDGVKLFVDQLPLVVQFEDVIQLFSGDVPVVLFVDLVDRHHHFLQFVGLLVQEELDEVFLRDRREALLVPKPLA